MRDRAGRHPAHTRNPVGSRVRPRQRAVRWTDRKSTRLNSSHSQISYAVFCLKKKNHTRTSTALWSSEQRPFGASPATNRSSYPKELISSFRTLLTTL